MPPIRPATPKDPAASAAIWNPVIRESAVTLTKQELAEPDLAARISPETWRLAEAGRVLGFACFGPFRAGPGYARITEVTIMLPPADTGQGFGAVLLAAIAVYRIPRARRAFMY